MAFSYFLGSKEERLATERAWRYSSRRVGLSELLAKLSGHDCRFELDGAVHKNGDVCVKLNITNDASNSRQIKVRMYANAKYYTGTAGEEIDDFCKEITVGAKKSKYFYHFLVFAHCSLPFCSSSITSWHGHTLCIAGHLWWESIHMSLSCRHAHRVGHQGRRLHQPPGRRRFSGYLCHGWGRRDPAVLLRTGHLPCGQAWSWNKGNIYAMTHEIWSVITVRNIYRISIVSLAA